MVNAGDMDLNLVRAFLAVAFHGSFTKAAQSLGQTKSNLSRRVSELERNVETLLLNRSTRRVSLTDEGTLLYEQCFPLLQEIGYAFDNLRDRRREPTGVLKVAAPLALGNFLMQRVVPHFADNFPDLSLVFDLDDKYTNIVAQNVDVAIRIGQAADQSLIIRKLVEISLSLYASPEYLQRFDTLRQPSDLASHRYIYYNTGNQQFRQLTLNNGERTEQVSFRKLVGANYFAGIKSLAAQGQGIVLLPGFLYGDSLKSGELVEVLPEWKGPSVSAYVAYNTRRYLSPKVRAFIDFIAADSRLWT